MNINNFDEFFHDKISPFLGEVEEKRGEGGDRSLYCYRRINHNRLNNFRRCGIQPVFWDIHFYSFHSNLPCGI